MKKLSFALLGIFVLGVLLVFQNCGETTPTAKEVTENILKSKTWKVVSVDVPVNTATESSDWVNFTVSFGASMTTAGHPTGATAVWPSGAYTVSEDGKSVTRGDNVVMVLQPITETSFTAIFNVPEGTDIGGRIAALEGQYTFNMN
jgi:hypothetical protein